MLRLAHLRLSVIGMALLHCVPAAALEQARTPASAPAPLQTAAAGTAALPRRIPAADFAQQPALTGMKLSPDGTMLLGRSFIDGKLHIVVHSLKEGTKTALQIPEKSDLRWYRWAGNRRVLVSGAQSILIGGSEHVATQLACFDVVTNTINRVGAREHGLEGDDVLYVDPEGGWLLLSIAPDVYSWQSVLRIDLGTNKAVKLVPARDGINEWYADNDGVVRAGVGFTDSGWSMIYRKTGQEPFRKLVKARYDDEDATYDMLRFVNGSDEGYILSNKQTGRFALYRFSYATKEIGEKIFESPTNDVTDFAVNARTGALDWVTYTDDRSRVLWYDKTMQAHQEAIDKAVNGREAWIVSRDRADSTMLVWLGASNDPGSTFVFRPEQGVMFPLVLGNAALKRTELAPSRYIGYKARDGLEIHGYLTLPVGREAKGLPLVIMPHGGPYGVRDSGDFDPDVQLLANRGYAVLQPNFRGSEGYGLSFYEKGEGQWGRQMQDDLDDGMDWLVREGMVDAKRVCIVGSSYGGYAALWGATRNPERYRCAASFAGVSDLGRQLRYQVSFQISARYRKNWRKIVTGGPGFDTATVSPLSNVGRLQVPVLLAHGEDDQTVPLRQSRLYAEALKAAGKPHDYVTYKGEGHGFSDPKNLQDWLERLDAFLAKHNPA